MNAIKNLTICLLVSALPACGDNLVEFPNGGGGGGGGDGGGDGDAGGGGGDADAGGDPAIRPMVISTDPDDGAGDVSLGKRVHATFDRAMSAGTISTATFTVQQGAADITGDVTYDAATRTATFTPDDPLDLSLEYTGTITTGAETPAGGALADDFVWSFDTGACGLLPMNLRSAKSFAVLAGSTVTSANATEVTGNLGVSPGTEVTGFPPATLDGTQQAGNPTAAQAILDLTTAYDDAAGRTLCAMTVSGNLGGQTLAPGLYNSTSSLEITSGDLTLDAGGDEDALFIFQMDSTFTTTDGRQVILSGGARAANVYWQVGTSATLGTTSVFHGTIMADQAITLDSGASLSGRALARIAAVTMDANPVATP